MKLKEKIKERGIKQSWVAEQIGVSKSLLHHYLSGYTNMPEQVERMILDLLK